MKEEFLTGAPSPISQAVGDHRVPLLRTLFEAVEAVATDLTKRNMVSEGHYKCLEKLHDLIKELK